MCLPRAQRSFSWKDHPGLSRLSLTSRLSGSKGRGLSIKPSPATLHPSIIWPPRSLLQSAPPPPHLHLVSAGWRPIFCLSSYYCPVRTNVPADPSVSSGEKDQRWDNWNNGFSFKRTIKPFSAVCRGKLNCQDFSQRQRQETPPR